MRTRAALLVCLSPVLAACGGDRAPGDVLTIFRGVGPVRSDTVDVVDGTYRLRERSQPASCITSIDIVNSDGQSVATITSTRPRPSPAADVEDPDFIDTDVNLSQGTYQAVGKAPANCRWAVEVTLPPDG